MAKIKELKSIGVEPKDKDEIKEIRKQAKIVHKENAVIEKAENKTPELYVQESLSEIDSKSTYKLKHILKKILYENDTLKNAKIAKNSKESISLINEYTKGNISESNLKMLVEERKLDNYKFAEGLAFGLCTSALLDKNVKALDLITKITQENEFFEEEITDSTGKAVKGGGVVLVLTDQTDDW
jgi:hypothetical protein